MCSSILWSGEFAPSPGGRNSCLKYLEVFCVADLFVYYPLFIHLLFIHSVTTSIDLWLFILHNNVQYYVFHFAQIIQFLK